MNKRWKTAIRFGLIWGAVMGALTLLFELQEKPFCGIIGSSGFWLRTLGYTILGIFPIGYFSYLRAKPKSDKISK
jgi:hypothetical protein